MAKTFVPSHIYLPEVINRRRHRSAVTRGAPEVAEVSPAAEAADGDAAAPTPEPQLPSDFPENNVCFITVNVTDIH